MRTIEIMVCYTDRSWDTYTVDASISEEDLGLGLDEQTLISLLPENIRTGEPGGPSIAAAHLYHVDQEVDKDKPETMEERLQRCCRLVLELADRANHELSSTSAFTTEDTTPGDSHNIDAEQRRINIAEVDAVRKMVSRAYDLRKAIVEIMAVPSKVGRDLPEELDEEIMDLLMDTNISEGASKLLGVSATAGS